MANRFILFFFFFLLMSAGRSGAQVANFPFFDNLESQFQCAMGCGTTCNLNSGWTNVPGDSLDWLSDFGGTPSFGTGPFIDHSTESSTGNYLFVETSCNGIGYPGQQADLYSPYMDFTLLQGVIRMEFWYHMWGDHMGTLHIDVDTSQGKNTIWKDFVQPITNDSNVWLRNNINVSLLTGMDSLRFRFRYVSGSNYQGDCAIDDFRVYRQESLDLIAGPIVKPFSSCNLDSAEDLSLRVTNYGSQSLIPGDSVPAILILDNLPPDTIYFILQDSLYSNSTETLSVSGILDLSEKGKHQLSVELAHPNDQVSTNNNSSRSIQHFSKYQGYYPYEEDFENGTAGWTSGGQNSTWVFGTPSKIYIKNSASAWNCWMNGGLSGKYNNGEQSWVQSPCFDFSSLCRPEVGLRIWWESEAVFDGAALLYSTNGGKTWPRVGSFGDSRNWYNYDDLLADPGGQAQGWHGESTDSFGSGKWVFARHAINNLAGKPSVLFRIVFASDGSTKGDGVAFDDFVIYDGTYAGKDRLLCTGDTVHLSVDSLSGDQILWSTGANTAQIVVNSPGTYWARKTKTGFCTTADTIEVISGDTTQLYPLGPDIQNCGIYRIPKPDIPDAVFFWNTGDSTAFLDVDSSGMYYADIVSSCGNFNTDSINVSIEPIPVFDLGQDTSICDPAVFTTNTNGSYLWSTGDTTDSITVSSTGKYFLTVTQQLCSSTDSVDVIYDPRPAVNLGPDTTICFGDTLCLTAGGQPGQSTVWSGGSTNALRCISKAGFYTVTVTNSIGCPGYDSLSVKRPAPPEAEIIQDSSKCPIFVFNDNSSGGDVTSWLWTFGDGDSSFVQNPIHDYSSAGKGLYPVNLYVSNQCGQDSTVTVAFVTCNVSRTEHSENIMKAYPNPFEEKFRLRMTPESAIYKIILNDVSGRSVPLIMEKAGNELKLSFEGGSGLYTLTVILENGRVMSQKIMRNR